MPVLENSKHELFAQGIAQGKSGRESYLAAGYQTKSDDGTDAAASRLLSDVRVQARIQELQARAANGVVVTTATLLEDCRKIIDMAAQDAQFAAASQTIERMAKIAGLWVDKSQTAIDLDVGSVLDQFPDG